MDELKKLLDAKYDLHHFYLIEGNAEMLVPLIQKALALRGISVHGNPSVTTEQYETLLVEDVARLKSRTAEKSADEPKISIIAASAITTESQHALLKVLEEPTAQTHFFIIVQSIENTLPTLRSRATLIRRELGTNKEDVAEARAFLVAKPSKRLEIVAKIIKEHEDDETSGPLRDHALKLLNGLEILLSENRDKSALVNYDDILMARKYLFERSASVKMILEHLALII